MIFEKWYQRNVNYYKSNFKRLSKGENAQFNWAALFGGSAYWAYRKMYGVAIGTVIINYLVALIPLCLLRSGLLKPDWIFFVILFVISLCSLSFYVWLAFNANRLYYAFVEEQIKQGYDKLEKFKPTSALLFWLVFLVSFDFSLGTILSFIGIVAYTAADRGANNLKREKDLEVTSEEINRYLKGTAEEHDLGKKARILIACLILISLTKISYSMNHSIDLMQSRLILETIKTDENMNKCIDEVVKGINNKEIKDLKKKPAMHRNWCLK